MVTCSRRSLGGAAVLAAFLLAGCELLPWTDEADPAVYGCDESVPLGTCVEHGALAPEDLSYGRGYCESRGGRWLVNEPCPAADRIGACDWAARGGGVQYFYASCTWCEGISESCTSQGGRWTAYP